MTTVLLPRPSGVDADAALLQRAGVHVLADPFIETVVRTDAQSLLARQQLVDQLPAAALVVTSVRALQAFIAHCEVPRNCTVYAIGPASASAAREAGFADVRLPTAGARNDALVERIALDMPTAVVIPRSSAAPSSLVSQLSARHIAVHVAVLYDTRPVATAPAAVAVLMSEQVDAVIVRSGSAARALAAFVSEWPRATRVVAAGEPTAAVLGAVGLPVDAVAANPDSATVVTMTLQLLGLGGIT